MNNILKTYVRQRIDPALMFGLAVFLFLFSRPVSGTDGGSFISFVFLIFFLLVFRLYDDLLQAGHDRGKPHRIYTDPAARKILSGYLIVFLILLPCFALFISLYAAGLTLFFITVNHILYLLFIKNKPAAGFLPLIKYPFIFFLLQVDQATPLFSAMSLFAAFVAFESLEDPDFPIPRKYACFLQALSFILIFSGKISGTGAIWFFLLLALSLIWTLSKIRAYPYVYLLLFLIFKMIIGHSIS